MIKANIGGTLYEVVSVSGTDKDGNTIAIPLSETGVIEAPTATLTPADITANGTVSFDVTNYKTIVITTNVSGGATKTVESITVAYSGGSVAVGTELSDLTGITVTAHYTDSDTFPDETVTGYTLSGSIAVVGDNTVTVNYLGKTATFTVVGTTAPAEKTYAFAYTGNDSSGRAITCSPIRLFNGDALDFNGYHFIVDVSDMTSGNNFLVFFYAVDNTMEFVALNDVRKAAYNRCELANAITDISARQSLDFTCTFTSTHAYLNWMWSAYCTKVTVYGIKIYDTNSNLVMNLVPTSTVGVFHDTVSGSDFTHTTTTGIELVEVSE